MPSQQLTTEDIHTLPVVLDALRNPRSPRSVLNYMCACDTSDPKVRDLLNTEEKVGPLLSIWFASGTALDALCQPFAGVVRELKADPPTLVGGEWDTLEGKVAKILLAGRRSAAPRITKSRMVRSAGLEIKLEEIPFCALQKNTVTLSSPSNLSLSINQATQAVCSGPFRRVEILMAESPDTSASTTILRMEHALGLLVFTMKPVVDGWTPTKRLRLK